MCNQVNFLTAAFVLVGFSVVSAQAPYELSVDSATVGLGDSATVAVRVTNAAPLDAWSFGVCHDESSLSLVSVAAGAAAATANGGNPPDFEDVQTCVGGFAVVAIVSLQVASSLPTGTLQEFYVANYSGLVVGSHAVNPCGTLCSSGIDVVLVAGLNEIFPATTAGTIEVTDPISQFVRSDANDDGGVDLGDAVWLLSFIFSSGPPPPCHSAADANNDGGIDVGDPVFVLAYIFSSGSPPSAPFPDCGTDPTVDSLTCDSFSSCP